MLVRHRFCRGTGQLPGSSLDPGGEPPAAASSPAGYNSAAPAAATVSQNSRRVRSQWAAGFRGGVNRGQGGMAGCGCPVPTRRSEDGGCIKFGLALDDTGGRNFFPLLSDGQSNPEGWQKVAGGSFQGCGGNDHRFTGDNTIASWRDARAVRIQVKPAISKHDPGPASQGSGTHSGCVIRSAFTRWSAPLP